MFTNSVANVGPGETVLISIEYQAPVSQLGGAFSLRLPLVIGPRYTPPHTLLTEKAVADANAVTSPPVLDPKTGRLNRVSITVHLAPGFAPANVFSPYHRVSVRGAGEERTITLDQGSIPADRDFELSWRSASADPTIGLFREQGNDGEYVMASITPPASLAQQTPSPREMVFVIDNSGSMGGESMREAKAGLLYALKTLRPQDHFNIIRFDDSMTQLFTHSVPATADQLALATRFATGLEASGGTEMVPALKAALADAGSSGGPAALRQVIFLTDGAVSNEQEMLATLGQDLGRSRVFFVGIGSAPNAYLMNRMATLGRGAYTNIGSAQEVAAKTAQLLDMLRHPSMQDIKVSMNGGALDLTPKLLPDLYAGQPLVLVGKTAKLSGTLTVSGTIGGVPWRQSVDLATARPSPAIAKLWARRRIDDVEADRTLGKIEPDAADEQVAELGIASSLVTSQTSLVAVDETPTRPAGQSLVREDLPINLPAGWDFAGLFGGDSGAARRRRATPTRWLPARPSKRGGWICRRPRPASSAICGRASPCCSPALPVCGGSVAGAGRHEPGDTATFRRSTPSRVRAVYHRRLRGRPSPLRWHDRSGQGSRRADPARTRVRAQHRCPRATKALAVGGYGADCPGQHQTARREPHRPGRRVGAGNGLRADPFIRRRTARGAGRHGAGGAPRHALPLPRAGPRWRRYRCRGAGWGGPPLSGNGRGGRPLGSVCRYRHAA